MTHKNYPAKTLEMSRKVMTWLLALTLLLSSLPISMISALSDEDSFFAEGYTRQIVPENPNGGLTHSGSFVPGYTSSNTGILVSDEGVSSSEGEETEEENEEGGSSASANRLYALRKHRGIVADDTLTADDVIIEGDTFVGLTDAGRQKVSSTDKIAIVPIESAHKIGERFFDRIKLQTLLLEEGITEVGFSAFQDSGLKALVLPDSLTHIGPYAFADNSLTVFYASPNLDTLGDFALHNNRLVNVEIAALNVGQYALAANRLREVRLTRANNIAEGAFYDNPSLTDVYLDATDLTQASFAGTPFDQARPVSVFVDESVAANITPLNDRYVINPITVTLNFKDKTTQGLLKLAEVTRYNLSDFPVTIDFSTHPEVSILLENYIFDSARIQNNQLTLTEAEIVDHAVNLDLLMVRLQKPQILVPDSKQVIYPTNTALSKEEILENIRFFNAKGEEVSAFEGGVLHDGITLNPDNLPAMSTEGTQHVTIRYEDEESGLFTETELEFTYTASTVEDEEIVDGSGWFYKDFTYSGSQLDGFSSLGLEKLNGGNRNVVLPGINPFSRQKITRIGSSAFNGRAMDTINFEKLDALERIEYAAFYNTATSALLNLEALQSLKVIGGRAFRSDSRTSTQRQRFTELDFSIFPNLEEIGERAFDHSSLRSVSFEGANKLKRIGEYAFSANDLVKVALNDAPALTRIEYGAFYINGELEDLSLQNLPSLEFIGDYAFYNSKVVELSLSDLPVLETIGTQAFKNDYLEKLTLANLPEYTGMRNYDDFRSGRLTDLVMVNLPKLKKLTGFYYNKLKNVTISNLPSLEVIGQHAFAGNTTLTGSIVLEDLPNLKKIESNAFDINTEELLDNVVLKNLPLLESLGNEVFRNLKMKNLVLEGLPQLTEIGYSTFWEHRLTSLTLKDLPSLTKIDSYAFANNGHTLEALTLENLPALEEIGHRTFSSRNLTSLNIPQGLPGLKTIKSYAFSENKVNGTLDLVTLFPNLEVIEDRAFIYNVYSAIKLAGHQKLKKIADGAFAGATFKYTILDLSNMPELEEIAIYAFERSGNQQNVHTVRVTNNPKLRILGGFPFNYKMNTVELANLPALEELGHSAFMGDNGANTGSLTERDLRPFTTLKIIGENAFRGQRLTELQLPNSVEVIGTAAYQWDPILDIDLSHLTNLKEIKTNAFYNSFLVPRSFTLPVTAEPIVLGREIVALTDAQMDFRSTPNVKVKLTDAQPFVRGSAQPTILRFNNDNQIFWDAQISNLNPKFPTIIYIDNITDQDRIASAPAGLLINPGKTTIKHVNKTTGELMPGTSETTRYLQLGDEIVPLDFAGYAYDSFEALPNAFAEYTEQKIKVNTIPADGATLTIFYTPKAAVEKDTYKIRIRYTNDNDVAEAPYYSNNRPHLREFKVVYDLSEIDYQNELGSKLVVTLPPHASTNPNDLRIPETIPGVTLKRPGYFNAETKQIVYEIESFANSNQLIELSLGFAFAPLDTPKGTDEVVTAEYILSDGRRKGPLAIGPNFKPNINEDYGLDKRVSYDWHNHHTHSSPAGSNNEYSNFSLKYTFRPGFAQRRLERIELVDTLPTYKMKNGNGDVVEVKAVFDPAKNPGWSLVPGENDKVTYTVTEEQLERGIRTGTNDSSKGFYDADVLERIIQPLVLDYPRAVAQTVINNVDYKIYTKNPTLDDVEFVEKKSTRTDYFNLHTYTRLTSFEKSGWELFTPYDTDTTKDHNWHLRLQLSKQGRNYEGKPRYERTVYSNVEVWDYGMDDNSDQSLLKHAGFSVDQDTIVDLYSDDYPTSWTTRPSEQDIQLWLTHIGTYTMKAGDRLMLPSDVADRVKTIRFRYDGDVDSLRDYDERYDIPEENRNLQAVIFDYNIVIHARLRDGVEVPNQNTVRRNYSNFFATQAVPLHDGPVTSDDFTNNSEEVTWGSNTYKENKEVEPTASVYKWSNFNNLEHTIRNENADIIYDIGYNAGWSDHRIPGTWRMTNFRYVDILPKEYTLEEQDITLDSVFKEAGGSVQISKTDKDETKLVFTAPSMLSSYNSNRRIARLKLKLKPGTPGTLLLTNRAYMEIDELPSGKPIRFGNPQPIPEEDGKVLPYTTHNLRLAYNSSAQLSKYVRLANGGAWLTGVQALPSEDLEYKVEVSNNFDRRLNKVKFFDIFPQADDTYIVQLPDGSKPKRGSTFAPVLKTGTLKYVRSYNYKTSETKELNPADYPVTLFSSLEGFPQSGAEGEVHTWIEQALANPAMQTTNPALAKAMYVGGTENSKVEEFSNFEFVFEMKMPDFNFDEIENWRNEKAVNSVAYFYEGLTHYTEAKPVTAQLIEPTKSLKFKKIDEETGEGLAGARFVLRQEGEPDKYAVSDENGWLYFTNVKYKNMTLQEVDAPSGYVLSTRTHSYNLSKADYLRDIQKPDFDPYKFENTGREYRNKPIPPPPTETIQRFTLNIMKRDIHQNLLANVKFKLEDLSRGQVYEALTNNEGQISFPKLRNGQYRLSEVANLNRYTLIDPITFDLPLVQNFRNKGIKYVRRSVDPQDENHIITTFEIHNETYDLDLLKLGIEDLKGEKLDKDLRSVSGLKLANVEFKLYETDKRAGESLAGATETLVATITTDINAKATLRGIAPNKLYKLQETVGANLYRLREEPIYFFITDSGEVRTVDNEAYFRADLLLVSNVRATVQSSVTVKKVDHDNPSLLLEGASFRLQKMKDDSFQDVEDQPAIQATGVTGELTFRNLEYGRYRIEEVEAPSGYMRSNDRIEFTVQPYRSQNLNYVFRNRKMNLRFEKVVKISGPYATVALANDAYNAIDDKEGLIVGTDRVLYRKLKGAQFSLKENFTDNKGVFHNSVVQPVSTEDANGYTVYEYGPGLIDTGSYLFDETVAPTGYIKAPQSILNLETFLGRNSYVRNVYVENTQRFGSVHISKYADTFHNVIPNVKFAIYKGHLTREQLAPEHLVTEAMTNQFGIIHFTKLPLGAYTLAEMEAPNPYTVIDEVTHFNITDTQTDLRYSFYNALQTVTLKLQKIDDLGAAISDMTGASFKLFYEGKEHSTGTLSDDEAGVVLFNNVPAAGKYLIQELSAPRNYVISGNGKVEFSRSTDNPLEDEHTVTLMNKHYTKVTADKTWTGGQREERPDVYFKLFRKVEGGAEEAVPAEEILGGDENEGLKHIGKVNAQVDFGSLPTYQHTDSGVKAYTYFVKEVDSDGEEIDLSAYDYVVTNRDKETKAEGSNHIVAKEIKKVNSYRSKLTSLTVNKTWKNGEFDQKPNYKFVVYRKVEGEEFEAVDGVEANVPTTHGDPLAAAQGLLGIGNDNIRTVPTVFTGLEVNNPEGVPYIYMVKEVRANGEELVENEDNYLPVANDIQATEGTADAQGIKPLSVNFVNEYRPITSNVVATKTWIGGPKQRPAVNFYLKRATKTGLLGAYVYDADFTENSPVVSLDADLYNSNQAYNITWTDLPTRDMKGNLYSYESVEFDGTDRETDFSVENYTKEEGTLENSKPLATVNRYVSPQAEKFVKVTWHTIDGEVVPASQSFTVYRGTDENNINEVVLNNISLTKLNDLLNAGNEKVWNKVLGNLDVTDANGNPYFFRLVAHNVNGYDSVVNPILDQDNDELKGFHVVNTQLVRNFEVNKVWVNATAEPAENNPEEVTVQLQRNGEDYRDEAVLSANIDADKNWKYTYTNLPTHDENGQAYTYTVVETDVPGYTKQITGGTVTNTREVFDLEVSKTWVDESGNLDKPNAITILLYRNKTPNATAYKRLVVTGTGNEWTGVFENLPRYDLYGQEYQYEIDEVAVPGYEKVIDEYSVTNTRTLTRVPVTKTWVLVDENDEASFPENITYVLKRDNVEINRHTVQKPAASTTEGAWNYTFETDEDGNKLALKHPGQDRNYAYTIEEVAVPGFSTVIENYAITNTQGAKTVEIAKRWLGGTKPNATLTLKRKVTVNGQDRVDADFSRSFEAIAANGQEIEVQGKTYTEVKQTYSLPESDVDGNVYTYYVEEENVPQYYEKSIDATGLIVTNTFVTPLLDLTSASKWKGGGQQIKPNLQLRLFRKVEGSTEEPVLVTVNGEGNAVVAQSGTRAGNDAEETTTVTWAKVPQFDENGQAYVYEVKAYNGNTAVEFDNPFYITSREDNGMNYLNVFRSLTSDFTLSKQWNSVDGEELPEQVQFVLTRNILGGVAETVGTYTLTKDDEDSSVAGGKVWTKVVRNLPLLDEEGLRYYYKLQELQVPGYERGRVAAQVATHPIFENGNVGEDEYTVGYSVTNTQQVTNIPVKVVWINPVAHKEPNPSTTTVRLQRNGEDYAGPVVLRGNTDPSQDFSHIFTGVPTHDAEGNPYTYTLVQDEVPAYTTDINQGTGVITNTREVVQLEITKTWVDESGNLDKPTQIQVIVKRSKGTATAEEYERASLTGAADANVWTITVDNLVKYDLDGVAYDYTIDEITVPGYEKVIADYSITNTRVLTTVGVSKTWNLISEDESLYPNAITYILKRDGQEINRYTMNKADALAKGDWNHVFTEDSESNKLPAINPGQNARYAYTVEEAALQGFTASYKGNSITNTQERINLTLTHRYLGGKKPNTDHVLTRSSNGQVDPDFSQTYTYSTTQSTEVTEGGKKYIVMVHKVVLPKYDPNGHEYTYHLDQPNVPNSYVKEQDGFVITNIYQIPKQDIEAEKVWENLRKDLKVPSITVKLYRRKAGQGLGSPIASVVLDSFTHTETNKVKRVPVIFRDVEITDIDGNEYSFTVREENDKGELDAPTGYHLIQQGMKLYNRYVPGITGGDDNPPRPVPPNPPTTPDTPKTPEVPKGDNPDKDRVPHTAAFKDAFHK